MKRPISIVLALVGAAVLQTCSSAHIEYEPTTSRIAVDISYSFLSTEKEIGGEMEKDGVKIKFHYGSKTDSASAVNSAVETAKAALDKIPSNP
jgi:enoyl-[acyl-carrier-protein] reductase (NADH)